VSWINKQTGQVRSVSVHHLFIMTVPSPNTDWLRGSVAFESLANRKEGNSDAGDIDNGAEVIVVCGDRSQTVSPTHPPRGGWGKIYSIQQLAAFYSSQIRHSRRVTGKFVFLKGLATER
jgi:hypothetical protein